MPGTDGLGELQVPDSPVGPGPAISRATLYSGYARQATCGDRYPHCRFMVKRALREAVNHSMCLVHPWFYDWRGPTIMGRGRGENRVWFVYISLRTRGGVVPMVDNSFIIDGRLSH